MKFPFAKKAVKSDAPQDGRKSPLIMALWAGACAGAIAWLALMLSKLQRQVELLERVVVTTRGVDLSASGGRPKPTPQPVKPQVPEDDDEDEEDEEQPDYEPRVQDITPHTVSASEPEPPKRAPLAQPLQAPAASEAPPAAREQSQAQAPMRITRPPAPSELPTPRKTRGNRAREDDDEMPPP